MTTKTKQQKPAAGTIFTRYGTHFQSIFLENVEFLTRPKADDLLKQFQDFSTKTILESLPLKVKDRRKVLVCDEWSYSFLELVVGQFLQDSTYNIFDMCILERMDPTEFANIYFRKDYIYIFVVCDKLDRVDRIIRFVTEVNIAYNNNPKVKNPVPVPIIPSNFYLYRLPRGTCFDAQLIGDPKSFPFTLGRLDVPLAVVEDDLFSMQQEGSFVRLFGEGDVGLVTEVFSALEVYQRECGYIPRILSRGRYAHQLADMMEVERDPATIRNDVEFMYIVDRTFDPLSPLLTATNYESLIDECYSVNRDCTTVDLDLSYFQECYTQEPQKDPLYKILAARGKGIVALHGNWYDEIRSLHSTFVPRILAERLKSTQKLQQQVYDEQVMTKKIDLLARFHHGRNFNIMQPQLYRHIMHYTNSARFRDAFELQYQFFENVFGSRLTSALFRQDIVGPIQELLLLNDVAGAFRLFAMYCLGFDGMKPESYDEIKRFFIHYLGAHAANIISKMEAARLLRRAGGEKLVGLGTVNAALKLYEKEKETETLYSGYTPLIPRSLEALLEQSAQSKAQDKSRLGKTISAVNKLTTKTLGEVLADDDQLKTTYITRKGDESPQTIILFVIGGISFGEIATIRCLAQRLKRRIIIGTTDILRKDNSLVRQFFRSYGCDFDAKLAANAIASRQAPPAQRAEPQTHPILDGQQF